MAAKSAVRTAAERCFTVRGVPKTAWVDRSQSGHRVKFFVQEPRKAQLATLRRLFAAQFPDNDTRVWYVKPAHSYAYGGLAFKVYNDGI